MKVLISPGQNQSYTEEDLCPPIHYGSRSGGSKEQIINLTGRGKRG